jgi:hypothetical protein
VANPSELTLSGPVTKLRLSGDSGYSATLDADSHGARLNLSDGRKWQQAYDKYLADKQGKSEPAPDLSELPTQDLSLYLFRHGDLSSAAIMLSDTHGKSRIQLRTNTAGEPSLEFDDEAGQGRAVLGNVGLENTRTGSTESTGPSSLIMFGKNGRVIWRAPFR